MKRRIFLVLFIILFQTSVIACNGIINESDSFDLYPAYEREGNVKKWGYINHKGDYEIDPMYDLTMDFHNKELGKVYKRNKVGFIDTNGEEIIPIEFDEISIEDDDILIAKKDDEYFIFDIKGKELFTSSDYSSLHSYSEDVFIIEQKLENETLMGFTDKNDNEIIEAKYEKVYNFNKGKAVVKTPNSQYVIINKRGKIIKELDYNYIIPSPGEDQYLVADDNLYGYLDENGDIIVEPQFTIASPFEGGYARVTKSDLENDSRLWGVINSEGEYVIEPEYTNIIYLGEDLFAVSKDELIIAGSTNLTKHALMTKDEELLTDYKYYSIGGLEENVEKEMVSAYNGETTYILDLEGNIVEGAPKITGDADIKFDGNMVKVLIDNRLFYYNKENELIWEEDNSFILNNGGSVEEKRYSPSNEVTMFYPKLEGLKDKGLENKINEKLYNEFIKGSMELIEEDDPMVLKVVYSINVKGDILIIRKSSYEHIVGITNGVSKEDIYHINVEDGVYYNLDNLFKADSNYIEKINKILKEKMKKENDENSGEYGIEKFDTIKVDQGFILGNEELKIYFKPSEITGISQGTPSFTIAYEEIEDIIDKDSKLWESIIGDKGN